MRARRPLSVRTKLLASAALVGLLLAGVSAVVQSAFTSTVRNPGNKFQAGSITLSGSVDKSTAMFDLKGMQPGTVVTRCIKVSYASEGDLASTLKVYGLTSGPLAPHVRIRVLRGHFNGPEPGGSSCTNFQLSTAIPMFNGALDTFPSTYATGLSDMDPNWTDGESGVFKIEAEVADTDQAQGLSATHELVFEARTNS